MLSPVREFRETRETIKEELTWLRNYLVKRM